MPNDVYTGTALKTYIMGQGMMAVDISTTVRSNNDAQHRLILEKRFATISLYF
jgi:hypothetical protein